MSSAVPASGYKRPRKTYEENSNTTFHSIPLISPLESTVQFEIGGGPQNSTGNVSSIPVSSSLTSGVHLFQYNGFFWDNSDLTFNYNNNSIALVLGHFQQSTQTGYFYIIPIFLPHLKCSSASPNLSTFENQSEDTPAKQLHFYLQQVCYYLNLLFCPTYFGDPPSPGLGRFPTIDSEARMFSPFCIAQDISGMVGNNQGGSINTQSPFFIGTPAGSPSPFYVPLLFYVNSSNQIACSFNPNYLQNSSGISDHPLLSFGFMSLESFFQDTSFLSNWKGALNSIYPQPYKGASTATTLSATMSGDSSGLIGKGVDLLGYYKTKLYNQDETAFTTFSDGYTESERKDFFYNYTRFPLNIPTPPTVPLPPISVLNQGEFIAVCQKFRFLYTYTNSFGGTILFPFTAQLIASRFITVQSLVLTRVQKRNCISNNAFLSYPGTIGIVYPGFIATPPNTFQDATSSSTSKQVIRGAPIISSRALINATSALSAYNSPIISMNPMYSIQSLDFKFLSEYNEIMDNFNQFQFHSDLPITLNTSLNFYQYFQNGGGLTPPTQQNTPLITGFSSVLPPPAPFNAPPYNPCPDLNAPNGNSILNNVNLGLAFMYFFIPSSCRDHTIVLPDTTNPSLLKNATAPYCKSTFNSSFLPGTILNHFARVIGF